MCVIAGCVFLFLPGASSNEWLRTGDTYTHIKNVFLCVYGVADQAFLPGTSGNKWLRTGDMGFLDARGALWLHGRAKDMVKPGGENVHAAEVSHFNLDNLESQAGA
jgi:acyl-CoA synthetase (AMP-forming)/AMP-acid ligase II